jgi:hypothetical protein
MDERALEEQVFRRLNSKTAGARWILQPAHLAIIKECTQQPTI